MTLHVFRQPDQINQTAEDKDIAITDPLLTLQLVKTWLTFQT